MVAKFVKMVLYHNKTDAQREIFEGKNKQRNKAQNKPDLGRKPNSNFSNQTAGKKTGIVKFGLIKANVATLPRVVGEI